MIPGMQNPKYAEYVARLDKRISDGKLRREAKARKKAEWKARVVNVYPRRKMGT